MTPKTCVLFLTGTSPYQVQGPDWEQLYVAACFVTAPPPFNKLRQPRPIQHTAAPQVTPDTRSALRWESTVGSSRPAIIDPVTS